MASEARWKQYTEQMYEGKLTGNAEFARECQATPLTAEAILGLVWDNAAYFGDRYYNALTTPIEMRVEEYFEKEKEDNR